MATAFSSLAPADRQYMENFMEQIKAMGRPASGVQPAGVFSQFEPSGYAKAWPTESKRFQALSKAYDSLGHEGALAMLRKSNGSYRATGWGPDLVKIAGLTVDGLNLPGISKHDGRTSAELEKSGWFSVAKAMSQDIRMPNGVVRKAPLAENSGQTGGYLVPPQFQSELLTIAAEDAFIEPLAKVVPMGSKTMSWPMLDITTAQSAGTSPYFGGVYASWQPEAATISETEPAFRMSEWTAWDLVMYSVASNQVLMDNGIGLDALLSQLFAQAITWYKEWAFLRGSGAGSNMPLGIINAPATYVQSRSGGGAFTLADVAAMLSRLHVRSWDSACWIMHQSVLPKLIQMTSGADGADRLLWYDWEQAPGTQKRPKVFFFGLPLYFTEKVPQLGTKGDVMLVDWSQYVIGNRLDYQIDVSKDYLFRTNQLAWRIIARCDGRPWLNNVITDSVGYTTSPFVVLNT